MISNIAGGRKFIFTDEANSSSNTYLDRGYSRRNLPLVMMQLMYETKPVYVVAAMNSELGLE